MRGRSFAGCGALAVALHSLRDMGLTQPSSCIEDIDLCWRMRLRGWSVIYDPAAMIRHHSGTTKIWSPFFLYLIERNRLAMVLKADRAVRLGGYGLVGSGRRCARRFTVPLAV